MQQLAEEASAVSSANRLKLSHLNTMITDAENTLASSPTASGSASGTGQDENSDAANKARQSLDHFGALVGIGGGDEFVDVSEELDGFENLDDLYEEPSNDDMKSEGPDGHRSLFPKSSASSFGTRGTGNSQHHKRGGESYLSGY